MTSIHPQIIKIFSKEKYFVILQGCRGSGKKQFANELKRYFDKMNQREQQENPDVQIEKKKHYLQFEICSIDDYYIDMRDEFGRNLSEAYSYCKHKARSILNAGKSVIYNNMNLDNNQMADIIQYAKNLNFCTIILRFFPEWDEVKCVEIARFFHPITQSTTEKQTIIRDNIVMFNFENEFRDNTNNGKIHKLPLFGIRPQMIQKIGEPEKMIFGSVSPDMKHKKQEYITAGFYKEKPIVPKAPRIRPIIANANQNQDSPVSEFCELPSAIKLELIKKNTRIQNLEQQLEEMSEQLRELTIGHRAITIDGMRRSRGRDNAYPCNRAKSVNDGDDDEDEYK
jgi:predicted kinase